MTDQTLLWRPRPCQRNSNALNHAPHRLEELLYPCGKKNGRHAYHNFEWTHPVTNKKLHVRYNVTHSAESTIVNIDRESAALAVTCESAHQMTLELVSPAAARSMAANVLLPNTLITGSPSWRCGSGVGTVHEAATPAVILRRIVSVRPLTHHSHILVLETVPATFGEFF